MPNCCAYKCDSGTDRARKRQIAAGEKPPSLFKIPKENREEFVRKLKIERPLTEKDVVCAVHFYPRDIIRFHDDIIIDGKLVKKGSPKKPELRKGALPHIFPGCPSYMTTPEKQYRPPPRTRSSSPSTVKRRKLFNESQSSAQSLPSEGSSTNHLPPHVASNTLESESQTSYEKTSSGPNLQSDTSQADPKVIRQCKSINRTSSEGTQISSNPAVKRAISENLSRKRSGSLGAFPINKKKSASSQVDNGHELSPLDKCSSFPNPNSEITTQRCFDPQVQSSLGGEDAQNDCSDHPMEASAKEPPPNNMKNINFDVHSIKLPSTLWAVHEDHEVFLIVKVNKDIKMTHAIKLEKGQIHAEIQGKQIRGIDLTIKDQPSLEALISRIECLKPCEGAGLKKYHPHCSGWVPSQRALRCIHCKYLKSSDAKKSKRQMDRKPKQSKWKHKIQQLKRSKERIRSKVQHLKNKIKDLHAKCKEIKKEKLITLISDLPEVQQQMVLACHQAAHCKGPHGKRYELNWIYECILMRIKSASLYKRMKDKKILPLPDRRTLGRYMRKLHPMYGYQDTLFEVLRNKVKDWPEKKRHGCILVDEMKLDPGTEFDRHTLKHWGFANLGKHTPDNLKAEVGDHALVVLFQPFQGKWVQALGCFLAKGNVKGKTLAKILTEGILLCEGATLHVDAIVCDGARWNRNMMSEFGVGEETSSCTHPYDENRKLWFFSDWCHLLKCMRNIMCPEPPKNKKKKAASKSNTDQCNTPVNDNPDDPAETDHNDGTIPQDQKYLYKELITPDGVVKRQHWIAVWNEEEKLIKKHLPRYVPGLLKTTVFPSGFGRMKVAPANKFYSNSMRAGMQWYTHKGNPALQDSKPSQKFIERINALAHAMNSGSPKGALWPNSKEEKDIKEFLEYHKQCIALTKRNGGKYFWSDN